MKICAYTCITGGYDSLKEPLAQSNGIDLVCFSDNADLRSDAWQVRPIPSELTFLSKVKQQRIIKICPHRYLQDYDVSVWIDGNLRIKNDLSRFIAQYDLSKHSLYTRIHPSRDCIYEEARSIIELKKDSRMKIQPMVDRYKQAGYPSHIGMAETNVLLRDHNKLDCQRLGNEWATEILKYSHRDQMSFNYICWKLNFLPGYLKNEFSMLQNNFFEISLHGKKAQP